MISSSHHHHRKRKATAADGLLVAGSGNNHNGFKNNTKHTSSSSSASDGDYHLVQVNLIKNPTISKNLNFSVKKKVCIFHNSNRKCSKKGLTIQEFLP